MGLNARRCAFGVCEQQRCRPVCACADQGFFARGVLARLPENRSDIVIFFSPQLILQFYSGLSITRFQRGSNIFQGGGGVQFFPEGVLMLICIEIHRTCDFPGGVHPLSPPGSAHAVHPRSLVSTLVIRLLENLIAKLVTSVVSIF